MKLGIIGNGFIVNDLLKTKTDLDKIEIVSLCVRKESFEKGKELCEKYGVGKLFCDLNEFLNDTEIDTVYIGVINTLHYEYAKTALMKGKNVICEKPFTTTVEKCEELFEIAEKNNVYLFEAITTIHTPMYKIAKENVEKIGKVRIINCAFCQYSSRYDRYLNGDIAPVFKKELFGGALVDLNIYNIHFVVSIFGNPNKIEYHANIGKTGVDTSGVLILEYGEFKCVLIASKDSESESFAVIQGEKGYIKISSPLNSCDDCIVVTKKETNHFKPNKSFGRMYYEMMEFERIISENDFECYSKLKEESMLALSVLEKAYSIMEN